MGNFNSTLGYVYAFFAKHKIGKYTLICFMLLISLASNAQTFVSSNLPIVIINTDGQQEVPNEPKIGADMKIIYHPDGSRNYLSEQNNASFLNYDGRIQIEIRGNSSGELYDKKPYSINTVKVDNIANNNVSILGMPKDNDWVLNSFAQDPTFSRDILTYTLSNNLGQYASRGKHCEVILNGEYVGVYLFCEKIKAGSGRVDISEMTAADSSGVDLTGGYIIQCDRPSTSAPEAWSYPILNIVNYVYFLNISPKFGTISSKQNNYIKSQFDALQAASSNHDASVLNGYPSVIDIPSFVDYMILTELASNADAYIYSTYFHKDKNGKLRAGPLWDLNYAYGGDPYDRSLINSFQVNDGENAGADFWRDLFSDPTFKCYFDRRWLEVTAPNQPLSYAKIAQTIDSLANVLLEAKGREDARWGTIGDPADGVNTLKNWVSAKIDWINTQVSTSACLFPMVHPLVISKINYNPIASGIYTSGQLEFIELTNNSNAPIDVSGYYFRELGFSYVFPSNSIIPANGKIYLAGDAAAFSAYYNYNAFGEFSRGLSNKSEKLLLSDAFGNTVDSVVYQSVAPWPTDANGIGSYLKLVDVGLDNSLASSWISSTDFPLSSKEVNIVTANHIYPNPSSNQINITNSEVIVSYEIYDEVGRLMMSENNIQSRNISINLENLCTDTYIIKTTLVNQKTLYDKVIKL